MAGARSRGPLALLAVLVALAVGAFVLGPGGGDGRRVVLYTAHSQEILDALLPRFREATGITPEVVKLGSGEVIQRVRAERENPRCDVIWSISGDLLEAHDALLEPYEPAGADALDPDLREGERWLPYTGMVVVLAVNTDLLAPEERPQRWTDLGAPALEGQVATARADKSGSAFMQLVNVLRVHEEDGWDVYRELLANARLTGSSSAVPRLVNDGEAAVGVTLEDNAHRYVRGGGPIEVVYPADGAAAAPDGIALVKGAPHRAEAEAFIDWALSKETQDRLVEELGRRPVRTDGATPPGLPATSELPTVPYDFGWAAEHEDELVERWRELRAELQD